MSKIDSITIPKQVAQTILDTLTTRQGIKSTVPLGIIARKRADESSNFRQWLYEQLQDANRRQ